MPPHDGSRLHEHHRRAPVPPDSDRKQLIARQEVRAVDPASHRRCRSARVSKINGRSPRSANASARPTMSNSVMRRSWPRRRENQRGRVLARSRCLASASLVDFELSRVGERPDLPPGRAPTQPERAARLPIFARRRGAERQLRHRADDRPLDVRHNASKLLLNRCRALA